ncbi:MAG TPA: serine/threonine-protein kinase [Gemmataceae bacterium]|nr:serine/threonine-protein kinase [Gemmataceae bacterium]HXR38514.1 serine/threonine-protein kinase [Terracidiphilus sp.]
MQHAHEQKMVHRDIKPQNLMLTPQGQVKILDFGLARVRSERGPTPGLTNSEAFLGTPQYVAPEQALDAHTADIRADIYSLGCTLYCLLTGRPPFNEGTALKTIMAHREKEAVPLHEVRREVPEALSAVVARVLAKDPAQRYQTPAEVVEALAPFCQAKPNLGPSATLPYLPDASSPECTTGRDQLTAELLTVGVNSGSRRRSPWRFLWTAAALVAGLVAAGIALLLVWGPRPKTDPESRFNVPMETVRAAPAALVVRALRVEHFACRGETAVPRGEIGVRSFSTRYGDQLRVQAELSEPASCFLLALNADGKEQLCWPADPKVPPERCERLSYPGGDQVFNLNDEVHGGLQAFVLLASRQPLPGYTAWRQGQPPLPWKRLPPVEDVVWRGEGERLESVLPGEVRGGVSELKGLGPLTQTVQQLRAAAGIETAAARAFPVLPRVRE